MNTSLVTDRKIYCDDVTTKYMCIYMVSANYVTNYAQQFFFYLRTKFETSKQALV